MNGTNVTAYSNLNVLIVEDNEVNQKVTQAMLDHFGIKSDIANNGFEALEKIQNNKYDIIFMDCQMPVMTGFEATHKIRNIKDDADTGTPGNVIIIAMTANALPQDIEACFNAGMNDFIAKPIELDLVGSVLEKWYAST